MASMVAFPLEQWCTNLLGGKELGDFPRSYCKVSFVGFLLLLWVWGFFVVLVFFGHFCTPSSKLPRAEAVAACQGTFL